MKHVIIGAGAAGISAARTIRQNGSDEIVIISTDDAVISRCMLHKYISGSRNVAELSFIPYNFFEQNNISWRRGTVVTSIDTAAKRVNFDGGNESYDRLLIATGAESVLPPIDGLKGTKSVYGLRHLSDAKAIRDFAKLATNIVIIGAGLVGLDAAYGLVEMGRKPTVVEMAATVLPQNMDKHAASTYETKFTEAGCKFMLNSWVESVQVNSSGAVSGITLDGGKQMPCDLLIVAVGVRPAIEFAKNSGIECGRGITVDDYFASSAPDVYAAGDATGLSESWPDAKRQGELAALNMCGIQTPYNDALVQKNTVNFFGVPTLSVGRPLPIDGDNEESRCDYSAYQKIILRDGVPVGVILQGDISRSGIWHHMIKTKRDISKIPKSIWKISFADAYGLDEDGEYTWI